MATELVTDISPAPVLVKALLLLMTLTRGWADKCGCLLILLLLVCSNAGLLWIRELPPACASGVA